MRKSIAKIKNLIKKVLAAFITTVLCTNGYFGVICSEVIANFQDEDKPGVLSSIVLEKYCNYEVGNDKGTLVQLNVQTGIEYKEGIDYKPIKNTQITLNSPVIEGEYPYSAVVIANSTKATNGKGFVSDVNYSYDAQTGVLQIFTENQEDENGNIYAEMDKNARDSYDVMYYYSSNVYNAEQKARQIKLTGNVSEEVADNDGTVIEKEINEEKEVSENIGNVVSTNVWTSDIYNGYIYSNINNGTSLETEYTEYTNVNVSYKEIADEIVINQNSNFVNAKDEDVEIHDVIYKGVKLNKQQIENILGEDFVIEVIDNEGQTITQINKDTETNENNIIEVNYEKEYTNVNFKISKPVKQGYLGIISKKAIKAEMTQIENNRIKLQQNIISQNNIEEKDETTGEVKEQYKKEVNNYNVETIEEIKDSESKIEVTCDKREITNETKNDVNFTAVLKTNDVKYNLFKNPEIEIEMPSEVDNVILGDVSLLYEDELKIKNSEVQDRNGVKFIKIELEGTQTGYSNSAIFDGANIVIPATIIVNKDIYGTESSIKVRYSNETGIKTSYENEGKDCEEIQINIASMNVQVSEDTNQNIDITALDGVQANLGESYVSLDDLEINLKAKVGDTELKDNNIVYEKEVIKYTVEIKNTSDKSMTNFNIKTLVPEGTTYIEKDGKSSSGLADEISTRNDLEIRYENKKEIEKTIQEIKSNHTWGMDYYVIVDDLDNIDQKTIENKLFVNKTQTNNINVVAQKSKMKVDIYPAEKEFGKYNNMYIFPIKINNTSDEKITNVKAYTTLAKEMELNYIQGHINQQYDDSTRKLTIDVGDIEANDSKLIIIRLNAVNFKDGISQYKIPFDLSASGDNTDTYRGDTQHVDAYTADVSVKMESPTEGQNIQIEENIEYNVTIKNDGAIDTYITVIDNLPEKVTAISAVYNKFIYGEDGKITEVQEEKNLKSKVVTDGENSYDFELETVIPKGSIINIKIIGEAKMVYENTEVDNQITVYGDEIGTKKSNSISNVILPFVNKGDEPYEDIEPDVPDDDSTEIPDPYGDDEFEDFKDEENDNDPDDDNENTKETYKINGIAWKDDNKDGIRNSDEEKLKGIKVKLFNAETNAIVVDENNNKKETTTNENGEYAFEDVSKGKYLIIFEYDTNTYTTTKYQVSSASSSENSDAIVKEIAIDGETKTVGVTDSITVKSSDIENIDIGLIESQIFDLKLDKYISKIVVKNSDGTKEYNYNNSQLAKIEIASKKMAESTVVIEYKIVVTNEGEISGKVDEIVDYIPEGLTFSSELNKDWYKGTDGKLRNSTLSQEELKAGESKTLVLTLTKAMTENSTGIVTNAAEITKATNANYVNDKDSTPGNNEQKEDDYSKAQVIISIKTGAIQYAMIIFAIIAIIFTIGLVIKNNSIKSTTKFLMVLFAIMLVGIYNSSKNEIFADDTSVNIHLRDLWIEYNKDTEEWIEHTENKGEYICVSPGFHLCNSEDHIFYLTDTSTCNTYDEFRSKFNNDENILYYFKDSVSASDFDVDFVNENDKNKPTLNITRENKSSDVNMVQLNNNYNIFGPFEFNLNTDIDYFCIKIDDTIVADCASVGQAAIVDKDGNSIQLNTKSGTHSFYLKLDNEKYSNIMEVTFEAVNSWTTRKKYVDLQTWDSPDVCMMGKDDGKGTQTLRKYEKKSVDKPDSVTDHVQWNINATATLKIIKMNQKGQLLKGTEFRIKGENTKGEEVYNKVRKTDKNGEIEVAVPIGTYKVTETKSPNDKSYPYLVTGDNIIIRESNAEVKKVLYDDEYYYFGIEKINANGNVERISGANIIVSESADNTSSFKKIGDINTDKDERKYVISSEDKDGNKSLIKVGESGSKTFKIYEEKAPDGYYNFNKAPVYVIYKSRKFYFAEYDSDKEKYIAKKDSDGNEIEITTEWKYAYDNDGNRIARIKIEDDCIKIQMMNPKIVKIGLEKIDADTKNILNGVGFKIYYKSNDKNYYISKYQWEGGDDEKNLVQAKVEWTDDIDKAIEFITGKDYLTGKQIVYNTKNESITDSNNGKIRLKGLPSKVYYAKETTALPGYSKISGVIKLYANKEGMNWFESVDGEGNVIEKEKVINERKNINISGMVFLDNQNANKNNTRDDLYKENEDDPDTLLKDVTVILKDKTNLDKNGNPKRLEIEKNMWSDEEYEEIKDMVEKSEEDGNQNVYKYKAITVGKNGKYEFKNVPIEYLENCYVEFQYNGLIYQAVKYKDKENGSKVAEKDRQEFNNKYAVIGKSSDTNNQSDKSYVDVRSSNSITTTKEYTTNDHVATLQWNMDEDTIKAVTEESYLKNVYDDLISNGKDATEITNVNCGVYLREQANISIVKDIDSIDVSINDKYYKYNNIYNKKNGQDEELKKIETDVGVKFGKKASEMTYSRPIYKADYMWENPDDRSKELQVDVTYMIKMTNNASGIKAIVGSIKDYYDKYYSPNVTDVTAYGSNGNTYQEIRGVTIYNDNRDVIYNGLNIKNIGVSKSELPENSSEDYGGAFEITLNQEIEHNSSKCIYVKLRLSRDGVREILDNKSVYSIKNVVEITRYGSKNGNGNIYAALDEQSAAGNAIPGKYDTYEGDTDAAPPLKIVIRSERTITGNVFLDVTSEEFLENQVREGNGEYNEGVDRPIGGIKVTLKPKEGTLGTEIQTYTDSDGKFTIGDFIPGDYNIEYEWGGNNKYLDTSGKSVYLNVQDYKSTIYKKERIDRNGSEYTNGTWYKGEGINGYSNRYSDAIDDYNRRLEIDEKLKDIHQEIKDGKVVNTNATDKTTMISTTPDMVFEIELKEIENNTYNVENVDFGIVKRPMQSIELNKFVESASLTLANGQVISNFKTIDDGNGGRKLQDSVQYTVYEPGKFVKFEMDKELFQGSTLKVTYGFQAKNTSEIDYVDEDFYKYGSQISTIGKTPVKLTPSMIVDFLDSDWPNAEFNNWSKDNLKDKGILTDSKMIVYANGEGNKDYNVVYTNDLNNKALAPGERSDIITITLSKLLSSGNDDISFGNDAEIIRTTKNGGARMVETIIHGNYKPGNAHESDDSQAENVYVIESTGKDLSYVLPIIITAIMLSVTGTGIILIKKKVLSN